MVFYRRVPGKETAEGSLIEGLRRREAAAWAEADRLRTWIEELAEDLARAEERVTRLAIAQGGLRVPDDQPPPELDPRALHDLA